MAKKKKKVKNGGLPTYEEYAQKTGQLKTYEQYTTAEAQNRQKAAAQAKQRQQESISRMTSFIRDTAAHEQNSRNDNTAPSTYAAKMMMDSHSSTEEENERRRKVNDYLEGLRKNRQQKQETSSFANYKAANKPEKTYRKTIGKKTTELEDLLAQMGKRPKQQEPEKEKQRGTTTDEYNTYLGKRKEMQKQGAFDNEKNPLWWSDDYLESGKNKTQAQIDDIDSKLDELKGKEKNKEEWYPRTAYSGWDNLYADIKDGRIKNGRDLLDYTEDEKNIGNRARDYYGIFKGQGKIRDDEESRRLAGERAFNFVYGYGDENSGVYDLVTEDMSAEEKADFDSKISSILNGMQNPYSDFNYDTEADPLNAQRDKLLKEQSKYTGEQDQRRAIADLEANAPDATGIADPERKQLTGGNNAMQMLVNSLTGTQGDDMDKAFWQIRDQQSKWNTMTTSEKIDMVNQLTGSTSHDGLAESLQDTTKAYGQYYAFMTPEQVDTFEKYYKTGDKNSARAYLEALRPYLQMYANEYSKYVAQEAATGDYGWAYGAMSVAQAPMNALVSGIGTVLGAAGNKEAGSANSTWFRGQNIQNEIRSGRREAWGQNAERLLGSWAKEPAEFLNGVFYSMADMAVATGLGGVLSTTSEISQPLVQFIMSSEAASNTMTEQLERGIDPQEAALYAVGSGVIEWFTEEYPIEQLLKPDVKEMLGNKKQIAKFIAKNFVTEGSEEGMSSVMEVGLDALLSAINGHESEIQEKINQLKGQIGEKNATQQVLLDQLKQTGMEMLAGGVSGLLMASARTTANAIEERATGKKIRTADTVGARGTDVIIDAALSMKEDMQSRKLAEEMAAKREAGEEISDMELGRLAQNLQLETDENIGNTARGVVEDRAFEMMQDSDMDESGRRGMAQIISKAVVGGVESLTATERNNLIASEAGFDTYKEFMMPTETSKATIGDIMDKTRGEAEVQQSVSELLNKDVRKQNQNAEDTGEQLATEEDIRRAEGTRTGGSREVIVDGKWAKLGNLVSVKETDENGEKVTRLKWQIAGTNETVDASQIKATDFTTAAIIRQAAINPNMFSNGFTNTLLKANDQGEIKNVGRFLLEAQRIRIASYIGQQLPMTTMQRGTAQEIFDQAKYEHGKNREEQVTARKTDGKVTLLGAEYGTDAWNKKLESIKDPNARAQIEAIAGLFGPEGIAISFRSADEMAEEYERLTGEKEEGTMIYGGERPEGISEERPEAITINIEGLDYMRGKNGEKVIKGKHNMMVTFGHEATHYLQRHSMEGYNQLESYVMNRLRDNGMDVGRRVMYIMNSRDLNIEDAISEIVADSCDQILANEEVANHIRETNQSLFKEIKGFVTDLVGRVRDAIKGMKESGSRESNVISLRSTNELARIWLGAYDDVLSEKLRQAEGNADGKMRMSIVETVHDEETLEKNKRTVANMDPAITLKGDEFAFDENHKTNVMNWFDKLKGVNSKAVGWVKLNKKGVRDSYAHGMAPLKALLFASVPETIKNGDMIEYTPNWKKRGYDSTILATKVKVTEGDLKGTYYVGAIVNLFNDGHNNYYSHDGIAAIVNENGDVVQTAGPEGSDRSNASLLTNILSKLYKYNGNSGKARLSRSVNKDTSMYKNYFLRDGQMIQKDANGNETVLTGADREYIEAYKRADFNRMEEILADKIRENGAIPFKTPTSYSDPDHRWVTNAIKNGDTNAIRRAAQEMAELVPDNAVLVPMPNHYGEVNDDTDTAILAREISKITGRPVVNALAGIERESRKTDKNKPKSQQMTAEDLGFRQAAEIPEGTVPYIVDNVIASGLTAEAAHRALGNNGVTLAYAKSSRTANAGLKRANVTFYDVSGNQKYGNWLIPLSERIDMDKKGYAGTKFSVSQANKILEDSGEIAAEPTRYSFAGLAANGGFSSYVTEAMRMEKEGVPEERITERTGCVKGFNGRWWKVLDRDKMHFDESKVDLKESTAYKLSDIYDAHELYEAYPVLKNANVRFTDLPVETWGAQYGSVYAPMIEVNKMLLENDYTGGLVESVLQHEIQHAIQSIEGSNKGSNETFWKDMKNMARARVANNDRAIEQILAKVGLDPSRDLMFGIEFNEDGTLDREWLLPEELEKVDKMSGFDLQIYRRTEEDSKKWVKVLQKGEKILYRDTVGEIEARAAGERTGNDQYKKIDYRDAIAREDYTGEEVTKFSMAQPVEQTKDLIAVHNLEADQLMKILQLGGFPMPSIAIIRDNYAHNRYGGVSVLFRKDTIDPKMFRSNKVYGGDAWTPTYPSVEYKIDQKVYKKVMNRLRSLVQQNGLFKPDLYDDQLETGLNRNRGDVAETLASKDFIRAAYLADKGQEINYPTKEKAIDGFGKFDNKEVIAIAEELGADKVKELVQQSYQYFKENPEYIENARKLLNDLFKEKYKGVNLKLAQKDFYTEDNFGISDFDRLLYAANNYLINGVQTELDSNALRNMLKEQIDEDDLKAWINDTFSGLIEKKGLRNNKDYFTNQGNRRSWEALHDEETLENVVRIMKQQTEKGEAAFFNQSSLLAIGTRDFKSIDEIRKRKGQLKHLSDEEMSAAKTAIIERVSQLQDELANPSEQNTFIARDRALGAIVDAVRSSKTEAGIDRVLRSYGLRVRDGTAAEIVDIMKDIANLPTEYFEAKPQRAVGLDEIAKVILPADTDQSLIDALEDRGIQYETYDGTDEDRLRAMNAQEDVKFSRATAESMDVGAWMMGQTAGSVQTEAERQLLQDYRDLRISISLSIKRQLDYKEKIRRLESREADLTQAERDDLTMLRNKLETQQQKQADLEDKLYKVTAADGWAGMMYHNNIVLNDFILGKTQDQVRESVEQMIDQVKAAEKIIAQQAKALRKLADSQAVKAVSSMINKKTLNYAVKSLKDMTNSAMGKKELESRLTGMALKLAAGEDITQDARELATDMTNRMRGYQNDVLERMRGVTIIIGPDQQKEMKGNGMTLASVREQLKGTGVKVKYGDFSSLDTDTVDGGDLRTLLPELPPDIGENSGDALFRFISWAQSMRDTDTAMKQQMVDIEDATMSTIALASTIKVGENTAEYQKQNQMAAQTRQMAGELEQAGKTLTDETDLAGKRAVGMASVLQRDVHEAIKYYNTIARMAAQEEKNKVKKNVIEQLKSQHTADLIKQQMKYEDMMKTDRKARGLAEDNLQIRNRINTVASRIRKRLMEETDLKNIPEEAKPLARQVLKMLVQHDYVGYRHVLFTDKAKREQTMMALDAWDKRDGAFKDEDLDWLIVGTGEDADWYTHDKIVKDLIDIESGLLEYRTAEGQKNVTLQDRKNALKKIENAVMEVWGVIAARETANINNKQMLISELAMQARDDMTNSRFKGEWTGKLGHGIGAARSGIVYGNMTPEYFFKNLRNKTISMLYDEYHKAENRNGLEVGKAKEALAKIAEETGYGTWDQDKRITFQLEKGGTVSLKLGEMMSLYATWQREVMNQAEMNGPEKSFHLTVGGFYTAQEEQAKILGREIFRQKAHRLTETDMAKIMNAMTPGQIEYVNRVVKYMTEDIGALGNEASMRMYGIKKYNEKWYFPFEIWSGVKSKKSDQGAAGSTENRAAHPSFSKRRRDNAGNALVIRDFTETAVKHIGGMINYNTFAPAIEFMNRVMNYQLQEEGEGEDSSTRRNIRTVFGEIYGKDALTYLEDFNKDVNGGVVRAEQTVYDKLLSTFKKSAVAGSLSVALQQPLSYIRASMMINPKYLALAFNPETYKGSRAEMEKYSGVAVIKRMGKFDMNFGQSARDYIMPERKEGTGKKIYRTAGDVATALPAAMDMMTWTRMWTACKLEQQAMHPEMDHNSKEFMEIVAERFNDVMRKTQVYDSMLVKSKNMRSQNVWMKALTSFMAEPTLTANVLMDAVGEVLAKDKGGKTKLAKAGATFILSAIAQALVKGVISAGRSPQKDKTWDENVAYRFAYNFMNEINPMNLIPGYSDLIEVLKKGELQDDAMSVIGKIMTATQTTINMISGKSDAGAYRDIEDSVGQLAQLFTNIPAKNIMRDARAMYNFFTSPYAQRETKSSPAVLKYQLADQFFNADNMIGVINTWLGEKGWETKNSAYYGRIYAADKAGKQQKVNDMMEYLKLARGTKQESIDSAIRTLTRKDDSLTSQQKLDWQKKYGLEKGTSWITEEYEKGNIDRKTAETMYRKENPKAEDKKVWEALDRIDYKNAGKLNDGDYYSTYTLLYDAIEKSSQSEIHDVIKKMLDYGYKKENIKGQLTSKYKTQYIEASVQERKRLADKLTKAYKEIGVTGTEALKIMQKWVTDSQKKNGKK